MSVFSCSANLGELTWRQLVRKGVHVGPHPRCPCCCCCPVESTMALNLTRVVVITLDGTSLHLFPTVHGNMFAMSEIAVSFFKENPGAFGKELRTGRYSRIQTSEKAVLKLLDEYEIPPESASAKGVTLLSPQTLEEILLNRRREDAVATLKISLLRMITEEAVQLLGDREYEEALPLAMHAVEIGQKLFYPHHTPQLVPLYLMAIQANLGLTRSMQSEDLLGLASWLLLQDRSGPHNAARAELGRLFGQLHVLQGNMELALKAFSEEIYYNSLEYGVYDTHTSFGFFHLGQVHRALGRGRDNMACCDIVIHTWLSKLKALIFDEEHVHECGTKGELERVHVDCSSPLAHVHSKEITNLLQEICQQRAECFGPNHSSVGEAFLTQGLLLLYNRERAIALATLEHASSLLKGRDDELFQLSLDAMNEVPPSE